MSKENVSWRLNEQGVLTAYIDGVAATWFPQPGSQEAFLQCPVFETLIAGGRGGGKRLRNDQRILTDSGWKQVGDVTMSDKLVAIDGTYTKIEGIFPSKSQEMYKLTFCDGAEVVADAEHLWEVYSGTHGYKRGWQVKTTKQIMRSSETWYAPLLESSAPGKQWTGPDPYITGLILGDGTLTGTNVIVRTADEYIKDYLIKAGFHCGQYQENLWQLWDLEEKFRDVLGRHSGAAKHVPQELLEADPHTRLRLLQGLMDADGSADQKGRCSAYSISPALSDAYIYLVRSLGGMASKKLMKARPRKITERQRDRGWSETRNPIWRIQISHANKFNPFALPRKRNRIRHTKTWTRRGIRKVEPCGVGDATCFAVKHPRKLFVIDGFVVTHNTDTLLMDFAQFVGKGFGQEWKGILFRRTFPELDDIIAKSMKWYKKIWPAANYNKATKTWTWPAGESLKFRHIMRPQEYWAYHGASYPWIAFEELTTWPNPDCYTPLFSLSRSSHPQVAKLCRVRATTNPYGLGHNWVRKRFGLPMAEGMLIGNVIKDTRTDIPEDERELPRVAIRSSLYENKILLLADPGYVGKIRSAARNPAELAAWIDGSWDITSGGMFDDIWDEKTHVVPDLPYILLRKAGWFLNRAYDHGLSKPFSVGWWAQSNGVPITLYGKEYGGVKGDLFLFNEYYGCTGDDNKGLNMPARDIARQIKMQEKEMGLRGRIKRGPADTSIFSKYDGSKTHAGDMKKEGVYWDTVDKSKGSREQGWQQIRTLLTGAIPHEGLREDKGIFVCERCVDWRRTVPNLSRDDKKLDDVNCFVAGTQVNIPNGKMRIEDIRVGDVVSTPIGYRKVLLAGCSGDSKTIKVTLSGGQVLEGTPDHKIYIENQGLVALEDIEKGMEICTTVWGPKKQFITESSIESILKEDTLNVVLVMLSDLEHLFCIDKYGKIPSGKYLQNTTYTTETEILKTTVSKILNASISDSTVQSTTREEKKKLELHLLSGVRALVQEIFSAKMLKKCVETLPKGNLRALYVKNHVQLGTLEKNAALVGALKLLEEQAVLERYAQYAENCFSVSQIPRKRIKHVVTNVAGCLEEKPVYNLTTEQAHLYYIDGVLVSNTEVEDHAGDMTRYRLRWTRRTITQRKW